MNKFKLLAAGFALLCMSIMPGDSVAGTLIGTFCSGNTTGTNSQKYIFSIESIAAGHFSIDGHMAFLPTGGPAAQLPGTAPPAGPVAPPGPPAAAPNPTITLVHGELMLSGANFLISFTETAASGRTWFHSMVVDKLTNVGTDTHTALNLDGTTTAAVTTQIASIVCP